MGHVLGSRSLLGYGVSIFESADYLEQEGFKFLRTVENAVEEWILEDEQERTIEEVKEIVNAL